MPLDPFTAQDARNVPQELDIIELNRVLSIVREQAKWYSKVRIEAPISDPVKKELEKRGFFVGRVDNNTSFYINWSE